MGDRMSGITPDPYLHLGRTIVWQRHDVDRWVVATGTVIGWTWEVFDGEGRCITRGWKFTPKAAMLAGWAAAEPRRQRTHRLVA